MLTEQVDALATEMLGIFDVHVLTRATDVSIDAITIDDAYRVQDAVIAKRVARGERVAGYKVGCTSRPIRVQFGLDAPVTGRLMHPHVYPGPATLAIADFVAGAIEPEFVYCFRRRPESFDDAAIAAAVEWIAPGIEIHNHRFFHGQPTAQELIASNAIHAAQVVGERADRPTCFDAAKEGVAVFVNGEIVASAVGAEVMGVGPLRSIGWLCDRLACEGRELEPGDLVIPGSPTCLVPVHEGDVVEVQFTHLGTCVARFE